MLSLRCVVYVLFDVFVFFKFLLLPCANKDMMMIRSMLAYLCDLSSGKEKKTK